MINNFQNSERITSKQGKAQYRVDKNEIENSEIDSITVLLYDSKDDYERMWCNFKISKGILERSLSY